MEYAFDVIPGTAIHPLVMAHMPQIVERVHMAYVAHYAQQSVIPASPFLRLPHHLRARIIPAPAYLGEPFNVAGIKWVASFPDNIQHNIPRASALLALNDPDTGYPYAVLEGSIISAARTAASAVLAAQVLRYRDQRVRRLGFLGTGLIARYIYAFFHGMDWDLEHVICSDAQRDYAEQFAAMVRATGQPNVTVYERAEDVLRVCDLTVLATTAATPHIHTADVLAYNPLLLHISLRDLAPDLLMQAQNVVDDVEHVLQASPCFQRLDDTLEVQLVQVELLLGDALLTQSLNLRPIPQGYTQTEAAAYLHTLAQHNPGVTHPLFDYLATTASRPALETMLFLETIRNEVVDDEVARLAIGLQGLMKAVAVSNLWDECGHGKPAGFHTYWLRRLLERRQGWDALAAYRHIAPWFTRIASNTFNVLLWRPAYTYRKYGFFLITESWVAPHFTPLLAGLQRVGLAHKDVGVYFEAHLTIDPHHGEELVTGFSQHAPRLSQWQVDEVLWGAHCAIAAYVMQCDYVLPYLVQMA